MVYCHYCGSKLRTTHSNKKGKIYTYYRCPNTGKNIRRCYCSYISGNKLEKVVVPFIYEHLAEDAIKIEICKVLTNKREKMMIPPPEQLWDKMSFQDQQIIVSEVFTKIEVSWSEATLVFKTGRVEKVYFEDKIQVFYSDV